MSNGIWGKPRTPNEEDIKRLKTINIEIYKEKLRQKRQEECFNITDNFSVLRYNDLTEQQKNEIEAWRQAWKDVTKTFIIPKKPSWLE